MAQPPNTALTDKLRSSGCSVEVAEACAKLFTDEAEARQYIGNETDAGTGFRSPWKEYFSIRYKRYYYCNDITGANLWDMPKPVQLQQWMMDADMYRLDVTLASILFRQILWLLETHWHTPELWECVQILAKLINNIVMCNNTIDKYRQIKTDNPKIQSKVLSLQGATDILEAAGFRRTRDAYVYPSEVTPMMMSAATLLGSRLQSLADRKGFTGEAKATDDPEDGSSQAKHTKWHGTPGFRYQQEIFECSVCGEPINDGSERLWSRSHDSPVGQFRYECEHATCQAQGGFHLCERCWDAHNKDNGSHLHTAGHKFRIHHPRTSRYQTQASEDENNPWGNRRAGAPASALRRLRDRYGIAQWL